MLGDLCGGPQAVAMFSLLLLATAPISVTSVNDAYPSLSPDGRTLLFQSDRSGHVALWVADSDGGNPRILFDHPGGEPVTPAWSPDGKFIVFAMRPDGAAAPSESDIFIVASDGRNPRNLSNAPGDDSHPHWSSDGQRIFFNAPLSFPDAPSGEREIAGIFSMRPDGTNVRRHIACTALCTFPVPSPDGRRIAFRKVLDEPGRDWEQNSVSRNSEIFVADIDGRNLRNLSNDPAFDGWPSWTADGRFVVFSSNRDGVRATGQIYRVSVEGGAPERLTLSNGWSRAQPSPASDGRIFVYELKEDEQAQIGHIAVIPSDGNSR